MNKIVFDTEDFVIVEKGHKVPTVPLKTQGIEGTLLGFVSLFYPEVLSVHGKNPWEGGALHRLDTDTAGLVVFAKNQDFYNKLSNNQKDGLFKKTYIAKTDGIKTINKIITSYFRSYGKGSKEVRSTDSIEKSDNGILYRTEVSTVGNGVYQCTISKGFRHQIRVHLASMDCPIKGDKLYNPNSTDEIMHLRCIAVSWPGFEFKQSY